MCQMFLIIACIKEFAKVIHYDFLNTAVSTKVQKPLLPQHRKLFEFKMFRTQPP